jgi:hypothetical protein
MLTHDLEGFGAGHARQTAGEGDGRLSALTYRVRRHHAASF